MYVILFFFLLFFHFICLEIVYICLVSKYLLSKQIFVRRGAGRQRHGRAGGRVQRRRRRRQPAPAATETTRSNMISKGKLCNFITLETHSNFNIDNTL